MIIGAVTLEDETAILKCGGESLGVFDYLGGILLEIIGESFLKSDGFSGNNMFEWTALGTWEDRTVDEDWNIFESVFRFFQRRGDRPPRGPRRVLWVVVVIT